MRIGMLVGAILIGLALIYGIVFVAGFPLLARMVGPAAYGGAMPGNMPMPYGNMPMMPGNMPMMQQTPPPVPTPPPPYSPQQPPNAVPWMMPGWQQMPYGNMPMMRGPRQMQRMPYGDMPMMRRGATPLFGLFGGTTRASGGWVLGMWRNALACIVMLVGAVAFTALGYVLGRRAVPVPAGAAAPAERPPEPGATAT